MGGKKEKKKRLKVKMERDKRLWRSYSICNRMCRSLLIWDQNAYLWREVCSSVYIYQIARFTTNRGVLWHTICLQAENKTEILITLLFLSHNPYQSSLVVLIWLHFLFCSAYEIFPSVQWSFARVCLRGTALIVQCIVLLKEGSVSVMSAI